MLRNLRINFFKEFRLYLTLMLATFAAYFVYIMRTRGLSYALSMENLAWFGKTLLLFSAIAALVATLTSLAGSD